MIYVPPEPVWAVFGLLPCENCKERLLSNEYGMYQGSIELVTCVAERDFVVQMEVRDKYMSKRISEDDVESSRPDREG